MGRQRREFTPEYVTRSGVGEAETDEAAWTASTRMTSDIAPAEILAMLPPAAVAPIVAHLLSDECTDTDTVLVVGGGQVQRVQQFANKGITFDGVPDIHDVQARWAEIMDMDFAVPGVNPLG